LSGAASRRNIDLAEVQRAFGFRGRKARPEATTEHIQQENNGLFPRLKATSYN